ncbi:Structural maintenance of chromosomes protein 6 [Geranomyces michiganensis]|nr:Structural maintenance of chromosomes protein 6 [Geranomyces michiganensis]
MDDDDDLPATGASTEISYYDPPAAHYAAAGSRVSKRSASAASHKAASAPKRRRQSGPISDDEAHDDGATNSSAESDNLASGGVRQQAGGKGSANTQEGSSGSIAHVELVNFMCHKYLSVPLGDKINFIVGHNGSGKSAILTGLAVCLGGRANVTNRAANLKEFLRTGSSVGSVTVTIRNEGPDAYRPDVYGNAIIVERKLRREGAHTYKIKSATKAVVSTKRDELLAILDSMQIHADNPMTILTQDAARSFLANSTPQEKYKFFMTGTGLRQLSSDYSIVGAAISTMYQVLEHKAQIIKDLKTECKKLDATVKDLEQTKDLGAAINELNNQWAWATVVEKEEEVAEKEDLLQKYMSKSEAAQQNEEREAAALVELDAEMDRIKQQISIHKDDNNPIVARREELRTEILAIRGKLKDFNSEKEDMRKEMELHRKNVRELEARIAAETRKLATDSRTTRKQQLTEISEREQQLLAIEGKLRELQKERDANGRLVEEAQNEQADAKRTLSNMNAERASCEEKIRNLRASNTDNLQSYGAGMRKTLDMIEDFEQKGRWRGPKPVGPIGLHVRLLEQHFARTIETVLGGALNSFVVETQEDLLLLQREIFNRTGCRSNIVKFRPRPTDFASGEPDQQYLTVLRALEINKEIVLQQLIVNHSIEKTVLVHTRDDGHRITSPSFPRNVLGVYTQDCFQVGNRGGGLSTQAATVYRGPPRLITDMAASIREEDQRMQQCERAIEQFAPRMQEIEDRLRDLRRHQLKLRQDFSALQRDENIRRQEINRMNDDLMDEEETNILGTLREAVGAEQQSMETIQRQYDALEEQRIDLQETERPLREQMQQLDREQQVALDRHNDLTGQATQATSNRVKAERAVQHWAAQREKYHSRMLSVQELLANLKADLSEHTAKVTEVCPRMEVTMSIDHIQREIRNKKARLAEIERTHGNYEDVHARLVTKKRAYLEAKNEVNHLSAFVNGVRDAHSQRMELWKNFRCYISTRAKLLFTDLMRRRGYRGRLLLNHTKGTLNLRVTINSNEDPNDTAGRSRAGGGNGNEKDPRSLSGGEKSYSTVCLLLSLWESMGSPFRALDEFDVFMDAVNRRMSMSAMIENAREADRPCQYIFITPQTMSNVPGLNGPDVRVHRLLDPERGQQTLSAGGDQDEED